MQLYLFWSQSLFFSLSIYFLASHPTLGMQINRMRKKRSDNDSEKEIITWTAVRRFWKSGTIRLASCRTGRDSHNQNHLPLTSIKKDGLWKIQNKKIPQQNTVWRGYFFWIPLSRTNDTFVIDNQEKCSWIITKLFVIKQGQFFPLWSFTNVSVF